MNSSSVTHTNTAIAKKRRQLAELESVIAEARVEWLTLHPRQMAGIERSTGRIKRQIAEHRKWLADNEADGLAGNSDSIREEQEKQRDVEYQRLNSCILELTKELADDHHAEINPNLGRRTHSSSAKMNAAAAQSNTVPTSPNDDSTTVDASTQTKPHKPQPTFRRKKTRHIYSNIAYWPSSEPMIRARYVEVHRHRCIINKLTRRRRVSDNSSLSTTHAAKDATLADHDEDDEVKEDKEDDKMRDLDVLEDVAFYGPPPRDGRGSR